MPGEPLSAYAAKGPLTAPQLGALAAALRSLWRIPVDEAVAAGLRHRRPASRADLAFGRSLITARTRPAEGVVAEAYDAALAWWDWPATALFAAPGAPTVIGHGDPNLANALWDADTGRVYLLDFEDAGVSDPALELGTLVEHLGACGTNWSGFLDGFAGEVDQERLAGARVVWAVFWLQMLMPGGRSHDRNPPAVLTEQAERVLALVG